MADLETLQKPKTVPPASASGRQWHWQWLVAPLMGFSVVLHIALLFVPLPTPAPPEEKEVEEAEIKDEEAIDILSLSDIEAPEPLAEQPPEQPQQSAAQSPDAVPPPDPTQVPESSPEQSSEAPLPVDDGLQQVTEKFDFTRRQTILSQSDGINAQFDRTEYFPVYAWNPGSADPVDDPGEYAAYLAGWQPQRYNCFFSSIDEFNYQLDPRADRLKYLSRNYGLVVNQDLPRTFAGQEIIQEPDGYCGEDFFTVYEGGVATGIYVSAIGVGPGDGNVILIFWAADPR
ncbi:MAG: hypothetical protein AAF609_17625 [Cyanobacteria bacterium P01_C01_bin.120]